jgi:hypothetical protein
MHFLVFVTILYKMHVFKFNLKLSLDFKFESKHLQNILVFSKTVSPLTLGLNKKLKK